MRREGHFIRKLHPFLVETYRVKAPVHGFVEGRSIVTNAINHKHKKYILNLDLEDFYGTINYSRVRGLLMAKPFNIGIKAASIIAQALCYQNKLPQGACTSPVISNFIASDIDKKLIELAKRYHCTYTRYADDITISCNKSTFPKSIAYYNNSNSITGITIIGKTLETSINNAGFKINYKKVRLQIPFIRQEVTGLTVNEFPNVKRSFIRNIRSMIFAWLKHGLCSAENEYISKFSKKQIDIPVEERNGNYFKSVIYGKLAFLKMVRGEEDIIFVKLSSDIAQLDSNPPKYVEEIMKKKLGYFDVFIGHASEDKKDVANPIFQACVDLGLKTFLDDKYIKWGDSLTEKINNALGKSRYFLAILSLSSIKKSWPKREFNSALQREINGEQKILPLIVGNTEQIIKKIPLIADKVYLEWDGDAQNIAEKIKNMKQKK